MKNKTHYQIKIPREAYYAIRLELAARIVQAKSALVQNIKAFGRKSVVVSINKQDILSAVRARNAFCKAEIAIA
jgi:hypothetical protein